MGQGEAGVRAFGADVDAQGVSRQMGINAIAIFSRRGVEENGAERAIAVDRIDRLEDLVGDGAERGAGFGRIEF